jgi:hypothetical protein
MLLETDMPTIAQANAHQLLFHPARDHHIRRTAVWS